ncbi:MAG: hypothetical protein CM1200mP11_3850 [Nitrosopumilaceae archaeon]|nr:MAG: hypothetical protein CM1200mP11_3850 [Nitrosopumilaceae archaeon]
MTFMFFIVLKKTHEHKTVVLRKKLEESEALEIIDDKKNGLFKSVFSRPKRADIHIHSVKLYYECILIVSGKYMANYFRKATHSISVSSNVSEVILGEVFFPLELNQILKKQLLENVVKIRLI